MENGERCSAAVARDAFANLFPPFLLICRSFPRTMFSKTIVNDGQFGIGVEEDVLERTHRSITVLTHLYSLCTRTRIFGPAMMNIICSGSYFSFNFCVACKNDSSDMNQLRKHWHVKRYKLSIRCGYEKYNNCDNWHLLVQEERWCVKDLQKKRKYELVEHVLEHFQARFIENVSGNTSEVNKNAYEPISVNLVRFYNPHMSTQMKKKTCQTGRMDQTYKMFPSFFFFSNNF